MGWHAADVIVLMNALADAMVSALPYNRTPYTTSFESSCEQIHLHDLPNGYKAFMLVSSEIKGCSHNFAVPLLHDMAGQGG